jgi:hypothetical protein
LFVSASPAAPFVFPAAACLVAAVAFGMALFSSHPPACASRPRKFRGHPPEVVTLAAVPSPVIQAS